MNLLRFTAVLLTLLCSPAGARDARSANAVLLDATSPFEDMTESALAKNDASITANLASAEKHTTALSDVLPTPAAALFRSSMETIRKAAAAGDHQALAMNAVEVFRLLIENTDATSLTVPREVSLLDYAGFKLHVLAAAPQPDWKAMRQLTNDAATWWSAIRAKISGHALRDAFDSTVRGLQAAGKAEHLPMLDFAAQMDLDLVDLLEASFEK